MNKNKNFTDQVIWITGASSGIGEALALGFAKCGAKLILSSRNEQQLQQVADRCHELSDERSAAVLPFDITDEAIMPSITTQAWQTFGRVDLLINNAGISQRSSFLSTSMQTYRTLFEVDVFGQIALTKQVVPKMIEQGSGHIAITSSVAGKIGAPFRTGYSAAKHAVMGYFDALRTEVAHKNIRVTTITPGFVKTNIAKNAMGGDGQAFGGDDTSITGGMDVTKAAKVMMKGFHKGKLEIPVGEGLEMHALRIKRFLPNVLFKMMNKQYEKVAASNDLRAK